MTREEMMWEEIGKREAKNRRINNIEFNITWCSDNLHYMLTDTPERQETWRENIAYMRGEVERLRRLLADELKGAQRG